MGAFVLDTCTCIFAMRRKCGVLEMIEQAGWENCYVSDVTVAELKCGAIKSARQRENLQVVEEFVGKVNVVPFALAIDAYAVIWNKTRSIGRVVEPFDLMIGATALTLGTPLVTDNTKHYERIEGLELENWVVR